MDLLAQGRSETCLHGKITLVMCDIISYISALSKSEQILEPCLPDTLSMTQLAIAGWVCTLIELKVLDFFCPGMFSILRRGQQFLFLMKKCRMALTLLKFEICSPTSRRKKIPHTQPSKNMKNLTPLLSVDQSRSRKHRIWDNVSSQGIHFTGELRLASEITWR